MGQIKSCIGFLFFFLLGVSGQAQDRYAVYFKFKPQAGFSLSKPQDFLTQKAIDRRIREGIPADSLDLPVSAKYLEGVSELSDYVLYSSKWMNAAVLVADMSSVAEIETLPYVVKVELVARDYLKKPNARLRSKNFATSAKETNVQEAKPNAREVAVTDNTYDFQNQLLGIDKMHEEGFTGAGVTVAVFDAGFPGTNTATPFAHLIANNQIIGQRDFVRTWNSEVFIDNQHGTNVLSLIAANEPGKLVSGAYDADFILAITEEVASEYQIEEFNWVRAAEYADSLGVDIINSSLGYLDFDDPAMSYSLEELDGSTAIITKGATIAAEKGILIINSVGNYGAKGESSLVAPADANGIISVGSVNIGGGVSAFSSRGPTGDGRFKPELSAYGHNPVLIRSNGAVSTSNGTSFSAPQITALAAGLWQAKPKWTKDELIENLLRSASQYENPDNLLGYGVPNFFDALYGEILSVEDVENVDWKIYPNPLAQDEISIQFGKGLKSTFELFDMTGRSLIQSELTRTDPAVPYRVQMGSIRPGLYIILLREGAYIKRTKLLRQ